MATNTRRILIRVTEDEYNRMLQQMNDLGLSTYSDLIRLYINTTVCFKADFDGLFEVSHQIAKIGNNINQIARAVNTNHCITNEEIDILQKEMISLEKQVAEAVKTKARITRFSSRTESGGDHHGSN